MIRTLINRFAFSARKTQLYDLHINQKGKMVQFAGYSMPVQYPTGIINQHMQCRQKAAIFDVSHMGQVYITGPDRIKLLERVTVGNTKRRSIEGITQSYLTLFLNQNAGIIDDAIAANFQKQQLVRIVVNAGNKNIDMQHMKNVIAKQNLNVNIKLDQSLALIALQGPLAAQSLQKLTNFDLKKVPFMGVFKAPFFDGRNLLVSRSGYTGQDGFQISGTAEQIKIITQALLQDHNVKLAGLGSRDSLRIQAGLCLHGHQMSTQISPFQSGLMWTVFKRKPEDKRQKFIGQDALNKIVADNKSGVLKNQKRVGFQLDGSGIVRQNIPLFNQNGQQVGKTSSGGFSPVLKKCVGMAYVNPGFTKSGTKLQAQLRGKRYPLTISKMPIVPSKYYTGWNDFSK